VTSFYDFIQLGHDLVNYCIYQVRTQEYVQSTMDDTVDDDRLKDLICDVGAESFCISTWICQLM